MLIGALEDRKGSFSFNGRELVLESARSAMTDIPMTPRPSVVSIASSRTEGRTGGRSGVDTALRGHPRYDIMGN